MTLRQQHRGIYWAWKAMKQRCQNPKCNAYHNYGARGIAVCDEWQPFEPFCEWALSNGYEKGLDLDRIDNDGDYDPRNCRWVDRKTNTLNRRCTLYVTVNGVTKPSRIWEDEVGIGYGVVKFWISKHGFDYAAKRIEDAISNGYKKRDYAYGHRLPIYIPETGERFESIKYAANKLGISHMTIRKSLYNGTNTRYGHFKFLEAGDSNA